MRKIVFIFVAAVFLIALGFTQGKAFMRPTNPVMNYVPQNVGIYDTYYGNFKETDCRACHGDSEAVSNRHHYSSFVFADCPDGCPSQNCTTVCHNDVYNPVTNPIRDCKLCHIDGVGTWVPLDIGYGLGNLGFPHHRSDLAGSGQCTACHQPNLLVDPKRVKPPFYYPVAYTHTPTPYACENCHWPSGNAPHQPPALIDWNSWIGLPKPTTWPDGLPHPAPIEANGPVLTGSVVAGDYPAPSANKPFRPNDGTHHEIDGKAYMECWLCHAGDSDSEFRVDPTDPLLIRPCENCHSKDSLHSIVDHVTAGQGLTVNQKCAACHGVAPNTSPVSGTAKPVIKYITPSFGPEGTSCSITGQNFGSSGDILLTPRTGETDQPVQISSGNCTWTNGLIIFNVPSGLLSRNYNLKVETSNGISNLRVFTLTGRPPCIACPTLVPNIDSMEPLVGTQNSMVTINGQNFGDRHTVNRDVLLANDTSTSAAPIISWTDSKIQFRFPTYQFPSGTIHVNVKTENGESNQKDFELSKTFLILESMYHPSAGVLSLSGLPGGFGNSQQYVRPDGYGWVSSVALNRPDGTIIPVSPDSIISWSDTGIQLTLPAIQFDFYGVTVDTKYFFDLDGNGVYTPGVDTIYQTVTSDPLLFRPAECNLVPDATTIPRGGTLGLQATGTNNTNATGSLLFATKVTLPNRNLYPFSGYLFGPVSFSLGPYQSKSKHLSQAIPTNAPLGTYTYHGYLGNYGVGIYDECTFTFTVTQ